MFKLQKAKLFALPLLASVALGGCGLMGEYNHKLVPAKLSSYSAAYEKRSENMRVAVEESNLSFDLSRFVDRRGAKAYSTYAPNVVLHTYDPDRLPGNAPGFVRSVMSEALVKNDDAINPQTREVFFELRNMDMRILNGNFISGEMGRYYVKIDADVMVRDGNGNVLVKKLYETKLETVRQSFDGRQPTVDEDWYDMTRTVKAAINNLTFDVMNDTLKATGDVVHRGRIQPKPDFRTPSVFAE